MDDLKIHDRAGRRLDLLRSRETRLEYLRGAYRLCSISIQEKRIELSKMSQANACLTSITTAGRALRQAHDTYEECPGDYSKDRDQSLGASYHQSMVDAIRLAGDFHYILQDLLQDILESTIESGSVWAIPSLNMKEYAEQT